MGSQRWVVLSIGTGMELLCLQQSTKTATVHILVQNGRWQQFDTTCSLISTPSSTIYPVVDRHEFIGSAKCWQTWLSVTLSLVYLDSARVWLSCYWMSVLASLCKVLPNPVTNIQVLCDQKFRFLSDTSKTHGTGGGLYLCCKKTVRTFNTWL